MSRIGNKPIAIPEGITVTVENDIVLVKGKLGELSQSVPRGITVEVKDSIITVTRKNDIRQMKMLHGTIRSLISNMIIGVSEGYAKELTLVGVGYRVAMEGNELVLQIGYKHPVNVAIPDYLKVEVPSQTNILISGIDKQKVGAFSAEVRALKPPEVYKGKGIRYKDEIVRRKEVRTIAAV